MPKERKAKELPYRADVDRKLASLRGVSRKDLQADDRRGASSPPGGGSHSQPMKRGRKK